MILITLHFERRNKVHWLTKIGGQGQGINRRVNTGSTGRRHSPRWPGSREYREAREAEFPSPGCTPHTAQRAQLSRGDQMENELFTGG